VATWLSPEDIFKIGSISFVHHTAKAYSRGSIPDDPISHHIVVNDQTYGVIKDDLLPTNNGGTERYGDRLVVVRTNLNKPSTRILFPSLWVLGQFFVMKPEAMTLKVCRIDKPNGTIHPIFQISGYFVHRGTPFLPSKPKPNNNAAAYGRGFLEGS
jgi:hypothetical protein